MNAYEFLPELILRCPAYAYGAYAPENLGDVIRTPYFQRALYLASPALWEALEQRGFDGAMLSSRERSSLLRYYNRMCFRPTPFGAFASFTMAEWGTGDELRLVDIDSAQLQLEVDQELGLRLAGKMPGEELRDISFTCNPLMYDLGKEVRFIRTVHGKTVEFEMESLPRSALTDQLFVSGFRKGSEMVALIREMSDGDEEAAIDYLRFLVDAGLLLPCTAPNIIGLDYFRRLLSHSGSPLKEKLAELMSKPVSFPEVISRGNKWRALLPDHKGSPFYAGLERKVCTGALDKQYQHLIRDGLDALGKLVRPVQPPMLVQFIRDFKARYDRQKIPLLQALDPDAGIIYGELIAPATDLTLLKDLKFARSAEPDNTVVWTAVHRLLLGKWRNNCDPIQLHDEDLRLLAATEAKLPPSLPVLFRVTADGLYLESVGGASATALIGRFTAWSDEVHELGKELAMREETANPDVIFADIGQLSDSHADNINRRAAVYHYEIPVNVVSLFQEERQIALSDLWVSVAGEELVLESRSLNKVVIPRLSSAYNYSRNNLAVFRLLCDLQYQGIQGNFSFDLENYFPDMAFYPRVLYKQTILSLATWYLSSGTLKQLLHNWNEMRHTLHLPPVVALRKADQQLVFRLDEAAEVAFLLECLKGLDQAVIQEHLLPADIVKADDGKPVVNQFIACLTRKDAVYTRISVQDTSYLKAQPAYGLGSKWLYLKLYVSPAAANALLTNKLLPLLKQLNETDLLSWFYIRYEDTGHHIRLRLQVKKEVLGSILLRFNRKFGKEHLLREYQADTYRRELERYGPGIMEKVEAFFHVSSVLVLAYLKTSGLKSFPYHYHSLAFVTVNDMLSRFLEPKEQLPFLKQMSDTFYTEFSGDKSLRVDLDRKYRELKAEISELLSTPAFYSSLKLNEAAELFAAKMNDLLDAAAGFAAPRRTQLLADLIHMHLNRILTDQQRKQELIIYHCLYKYRQSIEARR